MDSVIQMLGEVQCQPHTTSLMMEETANWYQIQGLGAEGTSPSLFTTVYEKAMALPMPVKVGAGVAVLAVAALLLTGGKKKKKKRSRRSS